MGFLDRMADTIITIKQDRRELEGLLDGLKDTFKKTDTGSTVEKFREKGLGGTIASWISLDPNKPITGEQIKELFCINEIKDLSKKSGLTEEEVTRHMSEVLPELIDRSTPEGRIDE